MCEEAENYKEEYRYLGMEPFANPDEFREKLQSLNLVGKIIKGIKTLGANYNYLDYWHCRCYEDYLALPDNLKQAVRKCNIETDPPLLILFDNGSTLTLHSYYYYYAELNALPWERQQDDEFGESIYDDFEGPNFNANVLFEKALKTEIIGLKISFGFGNDGEEGIESISLKLRTVNTPFDYYTLALSDYLGYSDFKLMDYCGNILEIPEERIAELFAGYENWTDN